MKSMPRSLLVLALVLGAALPVASVSRQVRWTVSEDRAHGSDAKSMPELPGQVGLEPPSR